jgi:hypothetical protein
MRIKREIISNKIQIAAGVTISVGDAVGISSGEAVLSDKDTQIPCAGLAKSVQGSIVYIQTEGKFANAAAGDNFWLGPAGSIVNTVPTSGMIQQIAVRQDTQNLLLLIQKTVILL